MKRNFTRILAAFALLVGLTIPMGMWGQGNYSATYSSNCTLTAGTNGSSCIINVGTEGYNGIKVGTSSKGGDMSVTVPAGAKYLHIHVAAWNGVTNLSLNITPNENVAPTSVALTANSGIANNSPFTFSGDPSTSDYYKVITFTEALTSETVLTFTTSIAKRFVIWGVNSEEEGSNPPTPTCATPTFNPAAGTYTEAQTVTISCATEGATIYYTTNGDNPTTSSSVYSSPITISETTTLKALAAATGYSNSAMASATYTITTPSTIAEVRAQGTGNVFTQGIVTSCFGTTGYIQDATAAICVYGNSLNVGDEIRVSGTLTTYHGLLEITDPQITILSNGNTVSPTPKTIAEINADDYTLPTSIQGLYVTIEEATVTAINGQNTTIAQGENTIVVRGIYSNVSYNVNDVLTLDGNIGCYDAAQIANPQNVTVQANTDPVINVTNSSIELAYNATSGEIGYTISNPADGVTLTATLEEGITWISNIEVGSESVTFDIETNDGNDDRSTTITLSYTGAENKVITVTQGHEVIDYAVLPFEYGGGVLADFNSLNGTSYSLKDGGSYAESNAPYRIKFTQTGDYLQVKCNEQPGKVTIGVKVFSTGSNSKITVQGSADGNSFDDVEELTIDASTAGIRSLETTTGFAADHRYVRLLFTKGVNVGVGPISIALPSNEPSVTVTPDDISVDCGEHTGTLNLQALNLENYSYGITYFEADGETTTMYSWINVTFNGNGTATYHIGANTGDAQSAYFKVRANDLSGNLICYSNLVTVYQAAYEAPFEGGTYMKASGIESGKTYIIVGGQDEDYAMGADRGNNRGAVSVVSDGLTITVEPGQAVYEFVIASIDDLEGYYTIYDPRNNGYLYAAGGNKNNYLKTGAYANEEGKGQWAISIDSENSIATIVANLGSEKADEPRNTMRFNSGNNPPIFSCYGSTNTMQDIYLYEKVATLTINGYTDDNSKTGYYLIASPVTFDPEYSDMTSGDFDLYYFDQNEELEWINYEDQTDGGFTLVPGKGYLYAKKANYEGEVYSFNLVGDPYTGDGTIELTYTEGEGIDFPGLNLVGNPFTNETTFTIYDNEAGDFPELNFLTMNNTGDGFITTTTNSFTAAVMQGFFVQATGYAQQLQVGEVGGLKTANLNIQVSRNRGNVIDNAIVNFGNASMMDKYYLSNNTTRVYIPQNNRDMAVVRSAAEGEMPVNFRASENGTYTIAVEAENVDMNYLHLIDNMTGADVDLLATPNYTFEARTNDYTSRFRLVFSANGIDEQTAETFAFFNGTSWTVSNTGDATLQVVDITGRIISSETINGNATVSLNQPAGIYMLRLVNGNDVKVQKVVVR